MSHNNLPNTKKISIRTHAPPSLDRLPLELIWLICGYCASPAGISSLARCNKQLHWSTNPFLYRGDEKYHAVNWAASNGRISTVRRVIEYCKGDKLPAIWLQIALCRAIKSCSWGTVRLLVLNGADANTYIRGFGCALQAASWRGDIELIRVLLDAGALINKTGGHFGHALQAAAWSGHMPVVELLLSQGADIDTQCGHYGSALQAASWSGEQKVVECLISYGARVDKVGGFYGSALQAASWVGNKRVVKALLQASQGTSWGQDVACALKVAYNRRHLSICKTILVWAAANVVGMGYSLSQKG
jgi:hypothetical protein